MISEIYGKTTAEDELTGNVFGTLRYLPASKVLYPFLRKAIGKTPLYIDPSNEKPTIKFWVSEKSDNRVIIPDIEIAFNEKSNISTMIFVEVKYGSPLSSDDSPEKNEVTYETSENQLIKQIKALTKTYHQYRKIELFLTTDVSYPTQLMSKVFQLLPTDIDVELYWLSWNDISSSLQTAYEDESDPFQKVILKDLIGFCKGAKGFQRFEVFTIGTNSWKFTGNLKRISEYLAYNKLNRFIQQLNFCPFLKRSWNFKKEED